MEVTKEQAKAYTEVIEILKYMPQNEVDKIPLELIDYYKSNMDTTYVFKINEQKSFEEQILLEKTKVVLAILFRDYWATEDQKSKIKAKEKYDLNQIELAKKEMYPSDNFFRTKNKQHSIEETKALVEYKQEHWYTKFIVFMKKIFGIKK